MGIAVDTSLQETIRVEICRNNNSSTRPDLPYWMDDEEHILFERNTFPVIYTDSDPCNLVNVSLLGFLHAPRLAPSCIVM
jgi:hypothetical protein